MNTEQIPVIVLTGFLGSGKTTLLNRLLREWPRTAVLINEFGKTPVDQQLIENQGIPLMTLSGGCLCCQVRGALAPVLKNIRMAWGKPGTPVFDRMIIETSGVASPEPVLDTLLRDRWLATHFHLECVVATIAAPSGADQLARFAEAQAQVAWADRVVITQTDLASASALRLLKARLDTLAPATARASAVLGQIDPDWLLEPGAPSFRRIPDGVDRPDHGFRSVSLHLSARLSWQRLSAVLKAIMLTRPDLVRVKGVVYLPDRSSPVAVHGAAGQLFPPVELPRRLDADGTGRLVMITAGPAEVLGQELMAALGGSLDSRAIRWH